MMENKFRLIALITVIVSFLGFGCQNEMNDPDKVSSTLPGVESTFDSETVVTDPCEITWDLRAGQDIDVGSVIVTNDADNIYVTYLLDYQDGNCEDGIVDAEFGELHVWVGNDLTLIDNGGECRPSPGQMAGQDGGASFDATGLIEYTFVIPWDQVNLVGVDDVCNKDLLLNVVTHAEVKLKDCDGEVTANETAYGGPIDGPEICSGAWWYFGEYTVCCGDVPPQVPFCETAFAKGGWVWTTGKKSNPEKLPSLELTKNRWGWVIELTQIGDTEYEIWAGAGLNNTSKGELVGTLLVSWDGSSASVTYSMLDGYCLEEVHLYAGDMKPTTIAPGQYGNINEFDPNAISHTFNVVLEDSGDGSVWLIAHAVVCNECP
ncbi:MAG: hypothetical protein ACEPOZ_01435 [Marinifilaceae bacterium]